MESGLKKSILSKDLKPVISPPVMTLRDYFAAKALVGLVGGRNVSENYDLTSFPGQKYAAELSYQLADAMLKVCSQ